MQSCPDLSRLGRMDWERLQSLVSRFEEACAHGEAIELTPYLPPPGDPLRAAVLEELIKTDLEIRWRRGQVRRLEQYCESYPELGSAGALNPQLIYEEFRVRQLYGDQPPLGDYRARFPGQFASLQQLLDAQPLPASTTAISSGSTLILADHATVPARQLVSVGGGYRLIERIGSGGSGEVWRGEGPAGFEVAIKIVYRPISQKEAQRELHALELIKRLRHPFLLQTQAYWQLEDQLLVVMELADGSLHDRLQECRQAGLAGIPLDEILRTFREAAEALDFLHQQHVLHRDIKPDNILLLQHHAKVADFGLASLQSSQRSGLANGSGSPAYMAPEIFWRGKVSERSDQYSLAVTYAELRLGQPLFACEDTMEVMRRHLQMTPDLAPLPAAEQEALLRALAKEPGQRFGSCGAFLEALERACAGSPERLAAESTSAARRADTWVRSRREWSGAFPPARRFKKRWFWACFLGTVLAVLLPSLLRDSRPAVSPKGPSADNEAVQVEPPRSLARELGVPAACVPLAGAEEVMIQERRFPSRMLYMLADGTAVEFVLVPRGKATDPETFYIMTDKVPVSLFRKFVDARPELVSSPAWQRGVFTGDRFQAYASARQPVLGVAVLDAQRCAEWLGGNLPRARQWDKAAGRFEADPGPGPFLHPWTPGSKDQVGVNRAQEGPLSGGTATHDLSFFGCRDMAGNGWEWTRDVATAPAERTLLAPLGPTDAIVLRGQSYAADKPLAFQDLTTAVKTQPHREHSPFIGFRVVIEPRAESDAR